MHSSCLTEQKTWTLTNNDKHLTSHISHFQQTKRPAYSFWNSGHWATYCIGCWFLHLPDIPFAECAHQRKWPLPPVIKISPLFLLLAFLTSLGDDAAPLDAASEPESTRNLPETSQNQGNREKRENEGNQEQNKKLEGQAGLRRWEDALGTWGIRGSRQHGQLYVFWCFSLIFYTQLDE